ncbi:hypothetical protein [Ferribacterium limneticum]|uniref:hypothetical protein n=1 Tax=Ferribacterium limneticum TaxID=76259 RepID=UPI001CFB0C64|nr:hypothetical protein [Ferribacterium limneticum]
MRHPASALIGTLFAGLLISHASAEESVFCHVDYAGQTQIVEARPTASPYTVEAVEFGSYLLFRAVFRREPADLASIKLYTYAQHEDIIGRPLIHQATYDYPPVPAGRYGFTGLNHAYEPRYGLVLDYWCELRETISK